MLGGTDTWALQEGGFVYHEQMSGLMGFGEGRVCVCVCVISVPHLLIAGVGYIDATPFRGQ